jgi:hypothetical protein
MNDFIAGPASSTREGGGGLGGGGAPPTVLIAALGAAILIAATLVGLLLGSGGGDPGTAGLGNDSPGPAATTADDSKRVVLTVQLDGAGSGRVDIDPSGSTCTDTCEHAFAIGTRVTLSPHADTDSKFEGWSDSCSGKDRCSVAMDRPRDVTVTFESAPSASTDTQAPDNRPASASDCHDGRDNDGDGLVDAAQDPDCAHGGMEAGSAAPSTTTTTTTAPLPPPPPPSPVSQCSDGRDNNGDGLIDRADPGCATGNTEGGGGAQAVSQCRDGRDNDGDGLIDRPADPGCDADGTEAGG